MRSFLNIIILGSVAISVALSAPVRLAQAALPDRTPVLIIGAGLGGLISAYKLKKKGIPFHIIEKQPRWGGRVATAIYPVGASNDRWIASNSGMEEFWESNPIVEIARELGTEIKGGEAVSTFMFDGQMYALKPGEDKTTFFNRILSAAEREQLQGFEDLVQSILVKRRESSRLTPYLKALRDQSFESWIHHQDLSNRLKNWIRMSLETEIGTEWRNASALDGIFEYRIFLGRGEHPYQVVGGNEKLIQDLVSYVGPENISRQHDVKQIDANGKERLVKVLNLETSQTFVVRAQEVITTTPLHELEESIRFTPPVPSSVRQAISNMEWGTYVKAHLFVSPKASDFWTREGASVLPILTNSPLGVIYDGSPQSGSGTKILTLLFSGKKAREFHEMKHLDEIESEIRKHLRDFWPGFEPYVKQIEIHKNYPKSVGAWGPGRSRFDSESELLRQPFRHIHLASDFMYGSHSNGAAEAAENAVKNVIRALGCESTMAPATPARVEPATQ